MFQGICYLDNEYVYRQKFKQQHMIHTEDNILRSPYVRTWGGVRSGRAVELFTYRVIIT